MDREAGRMFPWPFKGQQQRWALAFALLGLLGLGLLLLSSAFSHPPSLVPPAPSLGEKGAPPAEGSVLRAEEEMEKRLERLLSSIQGAGSVTVMITWEKSGEKVYAQDRQESRQSQTEKDGEKTRTSSQESQQWQTVFRQGTANPSPLLVEEKGPLVRGVLVVAEGAGDPQVAAALQRAVAIVLGIPTYQVAVFPGKGGR
ncbi:MAG: hypothetical protein QJR00_02475 [Bacillota bacterium]|nr:hypothetical protein [Bacillota bacterium]